MNECSKPAQERPYEMSLGQTALWVVMFAPMLLVAILGNCIVIWIVLGKHLIYLVYETNIGMIISNFLGCTSAHREMRTVTNTFLFNLSVADLLMSSMNGAPNFLSMLRSDWTLGFYYCSVNNFMAYATVASSVFTLVAISFDRYVAIVRPLHRRNSRKKARIFLFIIWFLSSALSFPGLMYSVTESKRFVWFRVMMCL